MEATEAAPLIDANGFWSLERLGYSDQLLTAAEMSNGYRPGSQVANRTFAFRLPAEAKQGLGDWYLVKLHYRLAIDEHSGPGLITVGASSNGRAMAQINFRLSRSGGELGVRNTSVGLVTGSELREEAKTTWEGVYTNYFQNRGVRPGRSTLSVYVAQDEKARIRSLRVFADSGIIRTRNAPSSVSLTPELRDRDIRVGERFQVGYRVQSVGDSTVPAGAIVSIGAGELAVVGSGRVRLGRIGKTVSGSFVLVADRPGTFPISLQVSSWGGTRLVHLAATVKAAATAATTSSSRAATPSDRGRWLWPALLGGLLACGAALLVFVRVRRTRPTDS